MGAFKRAVIAAEESGEPAMWGALNLDEVQESAAEALHDIDKPWMQGAKGATELEERASV